MCYISGTVHGSYIPPDLLDMWRRMLRISDELTIHARLGLLSTGLKGLGVGVRGLSLRISSRGAESDLKTWSRFAPSRTLDNYDTTSTATDIFPNVPVVLFSNKAL